jgi:shikimate O-hydroxycinnamoyltransferase
MKITAYKSSLIKPEIPTSPEVLSCSACDHFARPIHVRTIYFFGENTPGANKDAPAVLKKALSKLLVAFYPNAGRVRRKNDGTVDLEIDCNDAGVVFIEAAVDMTIDDLGGFQPNPLFDRLSPKADYTMPIEEQPVQFLQVNDAFTSSRFFLPWSTAISCLKVVSKEGLRELYTDDIVDMTEVHIGVYCLQLWIQY